MNIFAYTERVQDYPGYISINRDENGKHTITVRSRGNGGMVSGTVEITPELLESMLGDIAADLYRDDKPASCSGDPTFQSRVQPWMMACFGAEISSDTQERNHRFLEESLELVQACGATASEAHQLVDYVYGRPVGDKPQEVGGVMVTLAALCLAQGMDMHAAGETELARIWTKVEKIRAKQAAKPKHSPLPGHAEPPKEAAQPVGESQADDLDEGCCKKCGRHMSIPSDYEPTIICNGCAQYVAEAAQPAQACATKDSQIKEMVNRFLGWKLPKGFAPDCGISFKREGDYEHPVYGKHKYEPIGTNLLTAEQATEMFKYCVEGWQAARSLAGTEDAKRLDWIADNGTSVRSGRNTIISWATVYRKPEARKNLRISIDQSMSATPGAQKAIS